MDQQPPPPSDATNPRQQVLEQIKKSTNVLLTVSDNPTVDQLTAVIGMTLLLNKMDKHATAVFSGKIPPAIQFLQPEKTLEKTTDSLRDFIIALDKTKADKLRYKIEDKFVKIFITPYHTSLTDQDLEFSQGDYNVDVVLALGVKKRDELDKTIVEHGRILHDATVVSINNTAGSDMGSINWTQENASGLSEMMVGLSEDLKTDQQKLLDEQIATCFLTGIVAQTDRFSNNKTNSQTMSLAAKLMNAGANQQLIATKLEPPKPPEPPAAPPPPPAPPKPPAPKVDDQPKPQELPKPVTPPLPGMPVAQPPAGPPLPQPQQEKPKSEPIQEPEPKKEEVEEEEAAQDGSLLVPHEGITGDGVSYSNGPQEAISRIHIDDQGTLKRLIENENKKSDEEEGKKEDMAAESRKIVDQPPTLGGALSANTKPQPPEPSSDPLSLPNVKGPTLSHVEPPAQPSSNQPPADHQNGGPADTLSALEESVHSPHLREVDSAPKPDGLAALVGPDKGLPPDQTAGSPNPTPPPPVPPPLTMTPPPNMAPGNMSDPNAGVPL